MLSLNYCRRKKASSITFFFITKNGRGLVICMHSVFNWVPICTHVLINMDVWTAGGKFNCVLYMTNNKGKPDGRPTLNHVRQGEKTNIIIRLKKIYTIPINGMHVRTV